jgi:hypothetical protein
MPLVSRGMAQSDGISVPLGGHMLNFVRRKVDSRLSSPSARFTSSLNRPSSPSLLAYTGRQSAEAIGRRLLEIVVYDKCCRIGGSRTLDDLAETSEVGDWKMPDFKAACSYAASQGWLIVRDDMLTLTTAGLAAA